MRDLGDYQFQYKDQPFERFFILFRKRKIKEILQQYKHDCLLEIGCGLDPIFNTIDSYRTLFIVEPAHLFYEKAIEDLQRLDRKSDVAIINKLIENCFMDFENVKFDFVLLSSLLHEIANPTEFLSKIRAMISSDTMIHINVPNARSFHRLLAVQMGLIKDEFQRSERNNQFQQHAIYDLDMLCGFVENNGFKVVDKGTFSFKPFTHLQMENMIQAGLITEQMLEGFYKMEKYLPGLGSEIFVNVKRA